MVLQSTTVPKAAPPEPPGPKFSVISNHNPNFELLAYCLDKCFEGKCVCAPGGGPPLEAVSGAEDEAAADGAVTTAEADLLVVDCMGLAEEGIERLLADHIPKGPPEPPPIVLFNVGRANDLFKTVRRWRIRGIFFEDDSQEKFARGMRCVMDGGLWLSRRMLSTCIMMDRRSRGECDQEMEMLSGREKQILQLLGAGRSNQEIADRLEISVHTVKTHVYHIYKKIKVNNRVQATQSLAGLSN